MMNSRSAPLMRSDGKQQALRGSRIAIAVGIGIILGCIFAFAYPNGFFFRGAYDHSILGDGKGCAFQERRINLLKSELSSLTENNERLKQVKGMQSKLRELAVQKIKENDLAGEIDGGDKSPAVVAGPFGTVKSVRTNPTVVANSTVNPRLATILEEVAVNNELIVALASYNVKEMLTEWFTSIKKTGIPNYLVVALDDDTESYCKAENVPVYRRNKDDAVDSVAKGGSNHAISGLKFRILREFLQLGYGVLLSDIDIVYFKNPFDYLYRDCDVESMSDGHNNQTAYGYNDVSDDPAMGWARFAHTMRIWVYNSGFFYIRPTIPSIELLDRVATRLTNDHTLWDQAVFNEELTFPSSPGYVGLHASRRTMDIYVFMNSKVLFKYLRKEPRFSMIRPAVVHINYHPNKYVRMKAVVDYYVNGNKKALDVFPDGSE